MTTLDVLQGHSGPIQWLTIDPHGRLVASAAWEEANMRLWDLATGAEIGVINHAMPVGIDFSPDGSMLVSGGTDGEILLWDIETLEEQPVLGSHGIFGVYGVAFSPDGTLVASGGADEVMHLWDVATETEWAALRGHTDDIYAVTFSPDGSLLASCGRDSDVRLWNIVFTCFLYPRSTMILSGVLEAPGISILCSE
jgi:WD40 repeat protein